MKGLIVCRTGMGSSLMLKIKAQKVIDKHGWDIDLEHDVLSGLRNLAKHRLRDHHERPDR